MTKKTFQFEGAGPYTLQHGYGRVTVDDKGQAEIDTNDKQLMRLVEYFGGVEVKKTTPKKVEVDSSKSKATRPLKKDGK